MTIDDHRRDVLAIVTNLENRASENTDYDYVELDRIYDRLAHWAAILRAPITARSLQ